jgi:hypothetical protein
VEQKQKYAKLFEYFRQCPELKDLWSIASTEELGVRVILPQGASPKYQYQDGTDVYGNYQCEIVPYPSIYEDFQINCYEWYDVKDDSSPVKNENVLTLEQVTSICDWVEAQNNSKNFPDISEKIVSIECNPFVPQIRYVNPEEKTVGYFITVRLRYVNRAQRKTVEYECED